MVLKITGAALIIIACTAIGFRGSYKLYRRYGELVELKKILHLLKGEIQFGGTTLREVFETVAERAMAPYDSFFFCLAEEMGEGRNGPFSEIWRGAAAKKLDTSRLSGEEKKIFFRIGDDMGRLDKETQLKALSLSLEQLDHAAEYLAAELPKKMKLYNYLGILAGVFLTVFLI